MTTIDDLLNPRSVAVVGASDDPSRIGGRPIAYMKAAGFAGRLIPVNPKRPEVQGLPAAPSLADIEGTIDFALIALPAAHVAEAVRAARAKGAKTCLVFSSGFREIGEAGGALEDDLVATAREVGIRLIGPNCLGAFNAATGFIPTFSSTIDRGAPISGPLAIASQSGAYGSHIYYSAARRGLGTRYFLTTGNEGDVQVAEAIKLMAQDEAVRTILAYAEGIKDGDLLIDALKTAREARKAVVFMKVGRSQVGAAAAASHTASLAGEDAVFDAVIRQYGAVRAKSTEEMLDIAYAAQGGVYPSGRKLGVVTISGGAGVLIADAAEEHGLDVTPMPDDAQVRMKALLPFCTPRNPVDVTAQAFNDISLISSFLKEMIESGGYDSILAFWTSVAGSKMIAAKLQDAMRAGVGDARKLPIVQSILADPEIVESYEREGYPVFEDPTRAVAAIAALTRIGEAFARGEEAPVELPERGEVPAGAFGEREAKTFMQDFGLPLIPDTLLRDVGEAEAFAGSNSGRYALKIASPDIAHKTDVGGVALGVEAADVPAAFADMMRRVSETVPDARLDGVVASVMAQEGVDCILGGKIDPVFGPVVMFGLGGVFTEVFADVAFRHAPVSIETGRAMIDELKGRALLDGARGAKSMDKQALAEAIHRFSMMLAVHANDFESAEINPLRAFPDGCLGLDALLVRREVTGQIAAKPPAA